jgi:hypothetical protein
LIRKPSSIKQFIRGGWAYEGRRKAVDILVSNTALETVDIAPIEREDYFTTFKLYRKTFERIASEKYDKPSTE